jgi:hypothetical protein
MDPTQAVVKLNELRSGFEGEIYSDDARRILYATDASAWHTQKTLPTLSG